MPYPVRIQRDVVYRTAEGYWCQAPSSWPVPLLGQLLQSRKRRPLDLKMDIYLPEGDPPGNRPLLLMLHGGAYWIGNKEEKGQAGWCRHFASLGYVAVSADYRLGFSPSGKGLRKAEADALSDCAEALRVLLSREALRIDPGRVFLAGTSAGGAIALSLAYAPPANMPSCRIRAIGNLWGYVRNLDILRSTRVPILSFQSVLDPAVPYEEGYLLGLRIAGHAYGTRAVHEQAGRLGIPSEHHPVPRKGHRLHLNAQDHLTPLFYEIQDALTDFFGREL